MIKTNLNTQYRRSLLSKCAGYTQYFLSDVYTNSTQTKKAQVETVQCGRSMIEMLGVLAIVGVLSVGGIAGYSKAMEKFKINKTAEQISHIVTNIRTLYAQQTSYDGLDEQNAIKMGVVPDGLTTSNSWPYIINAFNGNVIIDDVTDFYGIPPFKSFIIHFAGLSKEACVTLATMDWGSPSSSGFIAISIGSNGYGTGPYDSNGNHCESEYLGNPYYLACSGSTSRPAPMSVTTAAEGCSACAAEGNKCAIGLRFQ